MSAQGNGLTLEGLAQKLQTLQRENAERLETLERENERVSSENAELRSKVTTLEASGTPRNEIAEIRGPETRRSGQPVSVLEGRVGRRSLLSKAGAAAVAAVAAGTLLGTREAKATHLYDPIQVDSVLTHRVNADAENGDSAVTAYTISDTNPAVDAKNTGIKPAVAGSNEGTGVGVEGFSFKGVGVFGLGYGELKGVGVLGEGSHGVYGKASVGYGGLFEGGKSQLRIVPKDSVGRPTTGAHSKGEIYLDSKATLFICTASGTPGTWRRVRTVAV